MTILENAKWQRVQTLVRSHPASIYFAATFALSWAGALTVAVITYLRYGTLSKTAGLIMFPVMLMGPCLTGILLTRITTGRDGLARLFARMRCFRLGPWYAGLLLPPALVLIVLLCLKTFVSSVYAPNRFFIGASFGITAGFFEEIGWMGFAFPMMVSVSGRRTVFASAVTLGVLWGVWHLPVIDYLGTATPHRSFLPLYFFTFVAAMTAMRVLIAWMYTNTNSVLLAQLMHASSTGALVALSPPHVAAQQEAMWYGVYAGALWLAVGIVLLRYGARLSVGFEKPAGLADGSSAPHPTAPTSVASET